MFCPNCKEKLFDDVINDQNILHCINCGGTFFEENGINRITTASAHNLGLDKKTEVQSNENKLCPKDQTILSRLESEENIPKNVSLFHCLTCKGIFTLPNDLVIFKKAQAAKIDYFKIWGIPLPSIRSVAVLSVFIFVSLLSLVTYTYWQSQNIANIQAEDLIKSIYITTSNRYLFISFKTDSPLKSRIIFTDITENKTLEKIVNDKPTTFHQLTTGDINIDNEIYYQIILTDNKERETKTEVTKLDLRS